MTQIFMYLYSKQDKNFLWRGSEWIIVTKKSDSIIVTEKKNIKRWKQHKKNWLANKQLSEASLTKKIINVSSSEGKL